MPPVHCTQSAIATGSLCVKAWYQASAAAKVSDTTAQLTALTTTKVETLATTDIDVTFALNRTGTSTYLQLTHVDGEGNSAAFKYKAFDANHVLQNATLAENASPVWAYSLDITSNLTDEQKTALLNSKVTITEHGDTSARIVTYFDSSEIVEGASAVASKTTTSSITVTLTSAMLAKTAPVAYVGIYVEGGALDQAWADRDQSVLSNLTLKVNIAGAVAD